MLFMQIVLFFFIYFSSYQKEWNVLLVIFLPSFFHFIDFLIKN